MTLPRESPNLGPFARQAFCGEVQQLPGSHRPQRVRPAGPEERLPRGLLLLLRLREEASEGGRVCPEGGAAPVQEGL